MNTLKEYYKTKKLSDKLNNILVETPELDRIIIEGIDQEEIKNFQVWFENLNNQANQFGLDSLSSAVKEAQGVLAKASGMLGSAEKVKSWMPFVDDMGSVAAFGSATLNLINSFENILKTITGQIDLTDDQKKEPLKIVLDGKLIKQLQDAVGKSLATPGLLGVFGKKAPFIGDKVMPLTSELIENSYEDLLDFGKQFPDKLPIDKEDAEDLAAGAKDEEAADAAAVDSSESDGGAEKRVAMAGQMSGDLDMNPNDILKVLQKLSADGKLKEQKLREVIKLFLKS